MGIMGLTSYINNRSDIYLEYYELHGTYLVIDGNSVSCQIYNQCSKSNCAFGGDYDTYAECVSNFFDDLLKCNVTPLVLIDGGIENRKMRTVISRTKQKARTASHFSPLSQQKMQFFPLFTWQVFRDVMREKNIRHVQCLFEADKDIAAVALYLNCPVLSYDSDFYIYGSLYIPFNTLDNCQRRSSTGKGYMMRCKIYNIQRLLDSFKGLQLSMVPLAAILLGNDYVKRSTFKNFFRHLKLKGASRKKFNHQQCRIQAVFMWLSKYTLDKAIVAILSRLVKPIRQRILNLIESNINSYTNVSTGMLIALGFTEDHVARMHACRSSKIYKFSGDIDTLTYIEEAREEDDTSEEDEEGEEETEITKTLDESVSMYDNAAVTNLPMWFVNEYVMAIHPASCMDIIVQGLYIFYMQVEDYYYPSSAIISVKILSVIFELLKSGISDKVRNAKYITRGQNAKLVYNKLEAAESIFPSKLPSLSDIRNLSLESRREILNNTLGIANTDCILELPPEWMLYIGCIKYWIQEQEPSISHECYLYSILLCLLFNIIDAKIGKYRTQNHFQRKYSSTTYIIEQRRKADNYRPQCMKIDTIIEAYNQIDSVDCLFAAPFFISHFEMDKKLYSNPKKFNKTVVHVFAEFQHCLRHAMTLNALLGQPYQQSNVANLYNGTLLYNLSNNFKARSDIEGYINVVFQKSPSLLTFFNTFLSKIKPMFPLLMQNEAILNKKQKRRSKCSKSKKNAAESDDEYLTADENLDEPETFYDPNNPFSFLYSTKNSSISGNI